MKNIQPFDAFPVIAERWPRPCLVLMLSLVAGWASCGGSAAHGTKGDSDSSSDHAGHDHGAGGEFGTPTGDLNPGDPVSSKPGSGPQSLWSDPKTWGGRVPGKDSHVAIKSGDIITLDVDACVNALVIEGELRFANQDVSLCARYIMVHGKLVIGTKDAPFTKRATITLLGNDPKQNIQGMGTKFLGAMTGGQIEIHAPVASPWTTLAGPVAANANQIEVVDGTGWSVGDSLAIASGSTEPNEAEVKQITAKMGNILQLDSSLKHARPGGLTNLAGRQVDMRAAVARLTRNVVIQGDENSAKSGLGGHTMIMSGGVAHIEGVEFVRMGQYDLLGRYPFHWHLAGEISGQYIKNSVVHDSLQRGIVVHGVQHGLVEGNVVFASVGHSYIVETPDTQENVFRRNLAMAAKATYHQTRAIAEQNDHEPSGFWLRSAKNTFEGNTVAGSDGNGFWYDQTAEDSTTFRQNVTYACAGRSSKDVVFLRQSGLQVQQRQPAKLTFEDFLSYNDRTGIWPTESGEQTYKRVTVVGSTEQAVRSEMTGFGIARFIDNTYVSHVAPKTRGAAAFALQYGGTAHLENVTFVGYGDRALFSTHDVDRPWTGDVRLKDVKFVDTNPQSDAVVLPEIGLFETLDDTFLPRGFYIPAAYTHLATPEMKSITLGNSEPISVLHGPERVVYGELATLLAGPDRFADRGAKAQHMDVAGVPLWRSDGYEYGGTTYPGIRSGYSVICNDERYTYKMTKTPPDTLFAVAIDLMGGAWQTSGDAWARVEIPLPSAPKRVLRLGKMEEQAVPVFEDASPVVMSAANSLAESQASRDSYYYDASAKLLHLRVDQIFTVVER